ncbi:MAG: hypothetical protein ACRC1K_08945 [Planctomycetia bacterium]
MAIKYKRNDLAERLYDDQEPNGSCLAAVYFPNEPGEEPELMIRYGISREHLAAINPYLANFAASGSLAKAACVGR